MVRRYDDATPEQRFAQAGREATLEYAQQFLADPVKRAWLEERIDELDAPGSPTSDLTPEQADTEAIRVDSQAYIERSMADPEFVAWLTLQIAAADAAPPVPKLQPGQLLEQVRKRLRDAPPKHRSA
ncbi:MAG: hypothetical protein ACR2H3_09360 [Acidimicrobiales bacterium]